MASKNQPAFESYLARVLQNSLAELSGPASQVASDPALTPLLGVSTPSRPPLQADRATGAASKIVKDRYTGQLWQNFS